MMGKPTRVTNHISDLRSKHDMTQAQLAELIGVTRQTVNAMERAKYSPTLEVAFLVAQVFNVRLDDVFAYE
jgi:putative transcriptional regulator